MGRQRGREETFNAMPGSSQSENDKKSNGKLQKSPKEKLQKGGKRALDDIDEQIKNLMDKKTGNLNINLIFKSTRTPLFNNKLKITSSMVKKINNSGIWAAEI